MTDDWTIRIGFAGTTGVDDTISTLATDVSRGTINPFRATIRQIFTGTAHADPAARAFTGVRATGRLDT